MHETAGVTTISLFVALMYARYWHESPLAERAPYNDMTLISLLHKYPVPVVREAAIKAFTRHLWYVSENLLPLALFDERVDDRTKAAMVKNFSRHPNQIATKRIDSRLFNHLTAGELCH